MMCYLHDMHSTNTYEPDRVCLSVRTSTCLRISARTPFKGFNEIRSPNFFQS